MVEVAFVGDVHGCVDRLKLVFDRLDRLDRTIVFLGDYVNHGPDSARVLDLLLDRKAELEDQLVLLEGNHDRALLDFVHGGELAPFLAMGGASTVRSYLGVATGEMTNQFRRAIPKSHVELLESLAPSWQDDQILAMHRWPSQQLDVGARFVVLGHYPQESHLPSITTSSAYIDTGCGFSPQGVLTCLLMPESEWFSC